MASSISDVAEWSPEEVCAWVASFRDLSQYVPSFQANDIDGAALLTLTAQELKDDLYISSLGHRKKILREIEYLRVLHNNKNNNNNNNTSTTTSTTTTNSQPLTPPQTTKSPEIKNTIPPPVYNADMTSALPSLLALCRSLASTTPLQVTPLLSQPPTSPLPSSHNAFSQTTPNVNLNSSTPLLLHPTSNSSSSAPLLNSYNSFSTNPNSNPSTTKAESQNPNSNLSPSVPISAISSYPSITSTSLNSNSNSIPLAPTPIPVMNLVPPTANQTNSNPIPSVLPDLASTNIPNPKESISNLEASIKTLEAKLRALTTNNPTTTPTITELGPTKQETPPATEGTNKPQQNTACEDENKMDLLETFPDEIKMRILSFIPQYDLLNTVRQISDKWKRLALSDSLWNTVVMSGFQDIPMDKMLKMLSFVNPSRTTVKQLVFDDKGRKVLVAHAKILYKIFPRVQSLRIESVLNLDGVRCLSNLLEDTLIDLHYTMPSYSMSRSTKLQSLSFCGYQEISRITILTTHLTRLVWIREDIYDSVDSQVFMQIMPACPNLRSLDMSICDISEAHADSGLDFVFTALQKLEQFRYNPKETEVDTQAISAHVHTAQMPQLRKFVLKCHADVTMTGRFDNLTHLNLAKSDIDDKAVLQFANDMPNLQILSVPFCMQLVAPVFNFNRLKELNVHACSNATAISITCPLLEELRCASNLLLAKLSIETDRMVHFRLALQPKLEELHMRCINLIRFNLNNISSTFSSLSLHLPLLRDFTFTTVENDYLAAAIPTIIRDFPITDAFLDHIINPFPFKNIKTLVLNDCTLPSSFKLDAPFLQDATFQDTKDLNTLSISGCPVLKKLQIARCKVLQCIIAINCDALTNLTLSFCPLLMFPPTPLNFSCVREMVLYSIHPVELLALRMPVLAKAQFDRLLCQKIVFACPSLEQLSLGTCDKLDRISFLEGTSPTVTQTNNSNTNDQTKTNSHPKNKITPVDPTTDSETSDIKTTKPNIDISESTTKTNPNTEISKSTETSHVNIDQAANKTQPTITENINNNNTTIINTNLDTDNGTNNITEKEPDAESNESTKESDKPDTESENPDLEHAKIDKESNNLEKESSTNRESCKTDTKSAQPAQENDKSDKESNEPKKEKEFAITIRSCASLRDDFFQHLPSSPSLSLSLSLQDQNFVHATVTLTNLKNLEIEDCEMVWVSILTTSLQTLTMQSTKFTTFNYDIPNIKHLSMNACVAIPWQFAKFPYIKHLQFAEIRTPSRLSIVSSDDTLPFLEEFTLYYMKSMTELTIDSSTLKTLTVSHCSEIAILNVHSHSLRQITLERNAWLQEFSLRCPELLYLSMPSCVRVSETSISQLFLPRARYLNFRRVGGLTFTQMRRFPEKFPNARAVRLVDVHNERTVKRILKVLTGQTSLDPPMYDPFADTTPDRPLENIKKTEDLCEMEPPELVSDSDYEDF